MFAISGLACCWPGTASADWIFDLDAATIYDNNLSRAYESPDIVSDIALAGAMSVGQYFTIDDRNGVALTANLRTVNYQGFHGMNSLALGATVTYRRKLGLGLYAPSIKVSGTLAQENYRQSVRDGQRSEWSVSISKRLSERLELSGGGNFEKFGARHVMQLSPERSGNAFDIKGRNLFARVDYALTDRWLGFAGINLRRGEVVASTRADDEVFDVASAVTRDPAFGPDYVAYRLSGETRSANVGVSREINSRASLNLTLARDITSATSGLSYRRTVAHAAFVYGF